MSTSLHQGRSRPPTALIHEERRQEQVLAKDYSAGRSTCVTRLDLFRSPQLLGGGTKTGAMRSRWLALATQQLLVRLRRASSALAITDDIGICCCIAH